MQMKTWDCPKCGRRNWVNEDICPGKLFRKCDGNIKDSKVGKIMSNRPPPPTAPGRMTRSGKRV